MSEYKMIGATIDHLMKHGGKAENSRGDTLEFNLKKLVFVKVDKDGRFEVAKLANEVLAYNWKIID